VELGRVLCAFGVVVIHSPMGKGATVAPSAQAFIALWRFGVPYFLMAGFYYAWVSLEKRSAAEVTLSRWKRLGPPYLAWSAIYVLARLGLYAFRRDWESVTSMFSDPVGLILFGDATLHLYYVPLLASGLSWFILGGGFFRRARPQRLAIGLGLSLAATWALGYYGNRFGSINHGFSALKAEHPVAGNVFLSILLAWAASLIQTAPYFFAAGLLAGVRAQLESRRHWWSGVVAAIGVLLVMTGWRSLALVDLAAGIGLFVGLLFQSPPRVGVDGIAFLGRFSAGCFFAHHLFLELLQIPAKHLQPGIDQNTPLWLILAMAVVATIGAYGAAIGLSKMGRFGRMLSAV